MASRTRARDVSTIVSILPYRVNEKKPGLYPGEFKIDIPKKGDFELLVIERCMHPVYLDETRPRLIVPDPSDTVAESIVRDHKTSIHGFIRGEAEPGIDWVQGEFPNTKEGKQLFAAQHQGLLREMERLQKKWFETLVRFADDDWARYKQHKFITSLQRAAVEALELDREWLMATEVEAAASKCRFCFSMVHPAAIVCPTCHGVLDQAAYDKNFIAAGAMPPQLAGGQTKTP